MTTNSEPALSTPSRVLLTGAAFIILMFGLQAAKAIVVPFLLAVFLSVIGAPFADGLQRRHVPAAIAVLIVVIAMMSVIVLMGALVGASLNEFAQRLPVYQQQLSESLAALFARFGDRLSLSELVASIDPGSAMNLATSVLTGLSGVFGQFFLIFFTVIFLLLEGSSFPAKLNAVLDNSQVTLDRYSEFTRTVQRYLAIKTVISLITGMAVTAWVHALGLDFPILWGILAFLFNYVPNIGSIIAAVPAVLLGVIQFGIGKALLVALGYAVINVLMGNIIEPRVMGRGLGLSPLVVFVSLVFWGWIFGPVGMLLSVPLTMTMKIAFQNSPEMRWLAVLLGPPIDEGSEQDVDDEKQMEASRESS